jgi:hypothetical protein
LDTVTPDEIMALVKDYRYVSIPEHVYAEIEAEIKALVPDPNVLTLPTPPPGTVALIGVESGRRWPLHEESGGWRSPDVGAPWKYSAVLEFEGRVRAEQPPPSAPRTAAAIWADRRRHGAMDLPMTWPELAEALDREAGLA